MEFLVVVAAAGAGYAAQYLQSSSGDKDNLLEQKKFSKISTHEQSYSNKNLFHQVRENFCPFRRLARKRAKKEVSHEGVFGFRQLNLDSSDKLSSTDCTDDEKSITRCCGPFNSTGVLQGELPNAMALLYMGITTGMISAIIANKREIEELNEKLNQANNLVQELQEELEMKEKFSVKELHSDHYEKPSLYSLSMSAVEPMSLSSSDDSQVNESTRQTCENTDHHLVADNHESSMSEIEAELEAELERLEMNMKFSSLERITDFIELDPEDEVDVAQGDLKLDSLDVQFPGSSDLDTSGTGIVQSKLINYPVSPRELSLRLHEVLESRLEAQIKDLETALSNSQSRACSLESHRIFSLKNFASTDSQSSASPESPYGYHESDEETIRRFRTKYGTLDIDKRVHPFDGALIDTPSMEGNDLIDIMLT